MILVTGGAGYIGSHTVVELLNEGKEVVIADNFSNSSFSVIDRIKQITGRTPIVENVNLEEKDSIRKLEKYPINGIIHFAALKAVGESNNQPIEYYQNNISSLLNVLDLMRKFDNPTFIFSSSATVYGEPKEIPITENHSIGESNSPYGTTKIFGEKIIFDFAKVNSANFQILRYFNPIGAHDSGLIGDNPKGIPNNILPYITQVAIGELDQLKVFGGDYTTKDGTCIRDYIHVVDLAKAHVKALAYENTKSNLNVFNLGTGIGTSVLELVKTFEKVNSIPVSYNIVERRKGDIENMFADPSLANNILDWRAELNLEDMLTSSWNFQKNISNE